MSERQLRQFLGRMDPAPAARHLKPDGTGRAELNHDTTPDFEPFAPLGASGVADFPTEVLPDTVRRFVVNLAEAYQMPPDLPGMGVLASASIAGAGRCEIEVREGHTEALVLFALIAMASGTRKTSAMRVLTKPISDWERDEMAEARKLMMVHESDVRAVTKQLAKLEKDPDAPPAERQELAEKLARLEDSRPKMPRVYVGDATPEVVMRHYGENIGNRCAIIQPEAGTIVSQWKGRYSSGGSDTTNIEPFLSGYDGEACKYDRADGRSSYAPAAYCPMLLICQPVVVADLLNVERFEERGLHARFAYVLPHCEVGFRDVMKAPSASQALANSYGGVIKSILGLGAHTIRLSRDAYECWGAYAQYLENACAPGGAWEDYAPWALKHAGRTARIAGCLHLLRVQAGGELAAEDMDGAIMVGRYLESHARAAFKQNWSDSRSQAALKVWRALRVEEGGLLRSVLWDAVKGGRLRTVKDLDDALSMLRSRGYLALVSDSSGARRRAERAIPNPQALAFEGPQTKSANQDPYPDYPEKPEKPNCRGNRGSSSGIQERSTPELTGGMFDQTN